MPESDIFVAIVENRCILEELSEVHNGTQSHGILKDVLSKNF